MQSRSFLGTHLRNFRQRWDLALFSNPLSSSATTSDSNPLLFDFLRDLGFQNSQAITIAKRYPNVKSLEQPRLVFQFLKNLGLSDTQIQESFRVLPQIMFCDAKKTLEPKIRSFEGLGLSGSALCQFLSKNSSLMSVSLERCLIPSAEILKTIVAPHHKDLTVILARGSWLLRKDPNLFLIPNISYLSKTCGINGSQLVSLLMRQPRLFLYPQEKLKAYVSRALDLGFNVNSGMLPHAICFLSCLSNQTFDRRFQLFVANGFSEDQTMEMIRKAPGLIVCADEKLKLGMKLYMKTMGIDREALVKQPYVFMFSLEKRVIPRLNVMHVLREKGLLEEEKNPSLFTLLRPSEKDFLERYVLRFSDEIAEELLVAYKGLVDRTPL